MFLVDTNVTSEARKGERANAGVRAFFAEAGQQDWPLFLSSINNGEWRRGFAASVCSQQRAAPITNLLIGVWLGDRGAFSARPPACLPAEKGSCDLAIAHDQDVPQQSLPSRASVSRTTSTKSGRRESNPHHQLGRLRFYH